MAGRSGIERRGMGSTKPIGWKPDSTHEIEPRPPRFVRSKRPASRSRVYCIGCFVEVHRSPAADPATPLQYCAAEPCQEASRKHDEELARRDPALEIKRWAERPAPIGESKWWN